MTSMEEPESTAIPGRKAALPSARTETTQWSHASRRSLRSCRRIEAPPAATVFCDVYPLRMEGMAVLSAAAAAALAASTVIEKANLFAVKPRGQITRSDTCPVDCETPMKLSQKVAGRAENVKRIWTITKLTNA